MDPIYWFIEPLRHLNLYITQKLAMPGNNLLVWFRSDLRLRDNPALHAAVQKLRQTQKGTLLALYVISPSEWKKHHVSKCKVHFILRNLVSLSQRLWDQHRIPLLVKSSPTADQVIGTVQSVCHKYQCSQAFWNVEYEINEGRRDKKVKEALKGIQVEVQEFHDQCVVLPGTLRAKSSDKVYTVYSPFKKSWFEQVRNFKKKYLTVFEEPASDFRNDEGALKTLNVSPDTVPKSVDGFELSAEMQKRLDESWPPSELAGLKKLQQFAESRSLPEYEAERNFPAKNGTSGLSPYLASGVLSAKECVVVAMERNNGKLDSGSQGIVVWIQELIWRDFYRHILFAYPRVCMNRPFKPETDKVQWRYDDKEFQAWCDGKTGYPIVDAGMRQLNETGWMHNRVRMIVASFLSKHLLQDWRKGEQYFMENLIDGDLASNNGGWQWAASTGTDAQPYFRVFNPYLQSQRFDPTGEYIRKYVPELRSVKNVNALHDPEGVLGKAGIEKLGYCMKIVEHELGRERAIAAFQIGGSKKARDADDEEEETATKSTKRKKSTKTK